ncbi:twin-arginine translocation signal domain-containing protein [Akkermansiaceae bacterium]|nr:twin-arginine translocation signal domain-containing protein [Akkermansiaceae bacterium]
MADEKGIHGLYDQLGDDAAEQIWGDNSGNSVISRRGFLSRSALGAMAAAVGGANYLWRQIPREPDPRRTGPDHRTIRYRR